MKFIASLVAVFAALLHFTAAQAQGKPIPFVSVVELSGASATPGTAFNNGVKLAVKEVNAAGGILGRKIELTELDGQSNPGVAKAMMQKAIDMGAYVVLGPANSPSAVVATQETERAGIPTFIGAEAASITQRGNPYVFRTSFTQSTSMPKLAKHIKEELGAKTVAMVWQNNDYGKGGRDEMHKALKALGINVVLDMSTDTGQVNFTDAVQKTRNAKADVAFIYLVEDESARILKEFRRLGFDKPLIGETSLIGQKVISLAGDAANGITGHVGLTADAPIEAMRKFAKNYQQAYREVPDHNAIKGYTSIYIVKAATEKIGKVDSKALGKAMKGIYLSAKETPGLLMDVKYDDKGDIDRQSFLVRVSKGKQEVVKILPPLTFK